MSVTALAAGSCSITIDNAIKDETYTLYKVFDATTVAGREEGATNGISYTSTWLTTSNDYFDVAAKGNISITEKGGSIAGGLSDDAIDWLKAQISNFEKIEEKTATETGEVEFTGLEDGYYYISTTTGSFVTVDSIAPNATVKEKNTSPSLPDDGKKQKIEGSTDYPTHGSVDVKIGDTIAYQVEINSGKGADKDIVLTDTMTVGLDYNNDITISVNNTEVDSSNYSVSTTPGTGESWTFKLTLNASYVKTLKENTEIIVSYSATVNEKAIVDSATGNHNNAELSYSNQTNTSATYVATYDFVVKKTTEDEKTFLPGAGFKLYAAKNATTGALSDQICVKKDNTGYYVDQSGDADPNVEIMVEIADGVNVRGLKSGTYYLDETTTPEGYNTLTEPKEVVIRSGQTSATEVTVINQTGTQLPSTGGIGTTIFYVIGAILVIGAGVILITRKRMTDAK